MFKRIEIWVLYLVIFFAIIFAVGFGVLVRQELVGTTKAGWFSKTALNLAEIPVNLKRALEDNDLIVEDRFPSLDGFEGTPQSEASYLLLSRYDGDLQEGIVELIDLTNFEVLHTWNPDVDEFNAKVNQVNEFKYLDRDHNNARVLLDHPNLSEDGSLVSIFGSMRKIDACSNLISQNFDDVLHHSIEIDSEENIWVPSRIFPSSLPPQLIGKNITYHDGGYYDDGVLKLSSDGKILFHKSVSQILIDNGLEYLLFSLGDDLEKDPIHLNDIQPADFDSDYWEKGDIFLSMRNQSMVLLYRPKTNKIIWKGVGPFLHQHDVDILDSNKISVFNNRSKNTFGGSNIVDESNEVIIYDFLTDTYSSYLKDSLHKNNVRTITAGKSQILPNGDLFVEETNYGRTLYFNSDGSLRWTHINRAKNGNVYYIGWSRIIYTEKNIQIVNKFLNNHEACNE